MKWVNNRINCHFIFLIMINYAYFSITFSNACLKKLTETQNSELYEREFRNRLAVWACTCTVSKF